MSKYHAKKTIVDGMTFDSRAEARRWEELKLLLAAGRIKNLKRQPRYELQPSYRKNGRTVRKIEYVADFEYVTADGELVVEDVKGQITPVYAIKKKIFEYLHPSITIKETKVRG